MSWVVLLIGLLAQLFFSARMFIQWFLSEKRHEVLSPTLFWVFSLVGSYLMFYYGWLRDDFSIIVGQFISFYIYIGNLSLKGFWKKIPLLLRLLIIITPPIILSIYTFNDGESFVNVFLRNENIPIWLVIFGTIGQITFTFRFIYQWFYSVRKHESLLPPTFWWISLTGSAIIISYAIIRQDPILILGQSFGCISYVRNLMIGYKSSNKEKI